MSFVFSVAAVRDFIFLDSPRVVAANIINAVRVMDALSSMSM